MDCEQFESAKRQEAAAAQQVDTGLARVEGGVSSRIVLLKEESDPEIKQLRKEANIAAFKLETAKRRKQEAEAARKQQEVKERKRLEERSSARVRVRIRSPS